jgi:hypothetical protein
MKFIIFLIILMFHIGGLSVESPSPDIQKNIDEMLEIAKSYVAQSSAQKLAKHEERPKHDLFVAIMTIELQAKREAPSRIFGECSKSVTLTNGKALLQCKNNNIEICLEAPKASNFLNKHSPLSENEVEDTFNLGKIGCEVINL